ncbi:hypothetical protein BS78_10G150500 [Paspalum vaginatum]|nr:hypothetical protein BS78_10G150500 [Paspalum vaginatum]
MLPRRGTYCSVASLPKFETSPFGFQRTALKHRACKGKKLCLAFFCILLTRNFLSTIATGTERDAFFLDDENSTFFFLLSLFLMYTLVFFQLQQSHSPVTKL